MASRYYARVRRIVLVLILGLAPPACFLGGCSSLSAAAAPRLLHVSELEGSVGVGPQMAPTAVDAIGKTTVDDRSETISTDRISRTQSTRIIETNGEIDAVTETTSIQIPVGQSYVVDGLIGQINGRPLYIDELLAPRAKRIMAIASDASLTRANKIAQVERLVSDRFDDAVNYELIIAEAESNLTPEAQMGVFGWLASVREETIAKRGGTRAMAEASIAEEFDMTLDVFLADRRTFALASSILKRRVGPRAIVTWRDVEQEYRRRFAEFNPLPIIKIGRIRLHKTRDEIAIASAKARIEEGTTFSALCEEFDVPDGGDWLEFELPQEGILGLAVSAPIKQRLEGLKHGDISEPFDQSDFVSWFAILEIVHPKQTSLYDPLVQIQLEKQLHDQREQQERRRYLASLRNRWISDDIEVMKSMLIRVAKDRYLGN